MKLILVSINLPETEWQIPYAAARLQAALNRRRSPDLSTELLTVTTADGADEIAERLLAAEPDSIGFSLYLWNRSLSESVASLVKERRPGTTLLCGGPEASADFARVRESAVFDLVLPGEGEELIVDTLMALLAGEDPAAIQERVLPAMVKDPAQLPSPYLDSGIDLQQYSHRLWELSRGCPFRCAFCYESRGCAGVREFSLETISRELEHFAEEGVERIFVLDPTFNYNRSRAKEILRRIIALADGIEFIIEIRAEILDQELVELFSQIRCSLQIGIQSIHAEVLGKINRTMDRERFVENIGMLNEAGIVYGFDLIYGLPGDTLTGFYESFDFAMALLPNHLDIFPLAVLPGTELNDQAEAYGLTYLPEAPYTLLSHGEFSAAEMEEARRFAALFDAFYNEGKAVSWFPLVLEYREESPAEFFRQLLPVAAKLPSHGSEPLNWQLSLLERLITDPARRAALEAVSDIVRLFHGAETISYDPDDLYEHLQNGITDPEELSLFVSRRG